MRYISLLILISLLITSCEEQMIPLPERSLVPTGRVVLMEEFTGVRCGPCYDASFVAKELVDAANGAIVIYAVHGGPIQSEPLPESIYDFNYNDPTELSLSAGLIGKPGAMFNRVPNEFGNRIASLSKWEGLIEDELAKPQVATVAIDSDYNAETRTASLNLRIVPLQDIDGDVMLHVSISESHLIDYQLSQEDPPEVPDFEHNHVMKASLTGLNGDAIGQDLKRNEIIERPFTYSLPAEVNGEWIPENMEVTAFITSAALGGEVLQAAQVHMTE